MLISPDEINKSITNKGWLYAEKKISKSYTLDTYMDGINFVQEVAELAENHNHHPKMIIGYCTIEISISSHEMNGVTTKCVNLATAINTLQSN